MKMPYQKISKKLLVIVGLVVVVALGMAGTTPTKNTNDFKNLTVLPKDISKESLTKIMKEFNTSLGVHCDFCHYKKDSTSHPDFASDSNHVKESARYMMRMTLQLNKESFMVKQPLIGDSTLVITCYTCHRGGVYPENKKIDSIPLPGKSF